VHTGCAGLGVGVGVGGMGCVQCACVYVSVCFTPYFQCPFSVSLLAASLLRGLAAVVLIGSTL
jgi:hypothetical protein